MFTKYINAFPPSPLILPDIYDQEKEKARSKKRKPQTNKHTYTHTDTLTNSLATNSVVGLKCGEQGVKGGLLIAYVQIILYISMIIKDLHASVTIVKNILNWL